MPLVIVPLLDGHQPRVPLAAAALILRCWTQMGGVNASLIEGRSMQTALHNPDLGQVGSEVLAL